MTTTSDDRVVGGQSSPKWPQIIIRSYETLPPGIYILLIICESKKYAPKIINSLT